MALKNNPSLSIYPEDGEGTNAWDYPVQYDYYGQISNGIYGPAQPIPPSMPSFQTPNVADIAGNIKIGSAPEPIKRTPLSQDAKAGIGLASQVAGGIGNKLISGGLDSAAGNAISGIGSTVGSAISTVNPLIGGIVTGASQVLGGTVNRLFGSKLNKENIAEVENNISGLRSQGNALAKSSNTSTLLNNWGNVDMGFDFDKKFIGKDGIFSNKAKKKFNSLTDQQNVARDYAQHALGTAQDNIAKDMNSRTMAGFAAYGGQLGMLPSVLAGGGDIEISKNKEGTFTRAAKRHNMGVQEFANHVLAHPEKFSPEMRKKANFARNASKWHSNGGFLDKIRLRNGTAFAFGGDLETNGADYPTGLVHVDAGGSHEENPYEGVQMGVAPDGQPNLVEEGESIYKDDDYVFSDRIKLDKDAQKRLKMRGDMTYAKASKKLEKEAEERPNDPISRASLKRMLSVLEGEQERQKAEAEAKEAMKAFESLSPEQQQAVIAQIGQLAEQQEQAEQADAMGQGEEGTPQDQQAMQEQAMQQQAAQQQMEHGMPGQQAPSEDEVEEMRRQDEMARAQQAEYYGAYGGKLHKFDNGGMLQAIARALNIPTIAGLDKWANDNKLGKIDWKNLTWDLAKGNKPLLGALSNGNLALADAIDKGYDFGYYVPETGRVTIDYKHGGWGAEDGPAWKGSQDPAYLEALKNGFVSDKSTVEEMMNGLAKTEAYKKGTEWLQASEGNRLKYLQAVLASPDAPKAAKDYAKKFVDEKGWKDKAAKDYDAIFGTVRTTHPGTYWKTPQEVVREAKTVNMLLNGDKKGYSEAMYVPEEYGKAKHTYVVRTPEGDITYNYFDPQEAKAADKAVEDSGNDAKPFEKIPYRNEALRYAGLAGPAAGLGLWAAGVGKPDFSSNRKAENLASEAYFTGYTPFGQRMTYTPFDVWSAQNRADAKLAATDRALLNSGLPIGTRNAGLIANSYAGQLGLGQTLRAADESNLSRKAQTLATNNALDQANAAAADKAMLANAGIANSNRGTLAKLVAADGQMEQAAKAGWNNALYGNLGQLFQGLGDLGRENATYNQLAAVANSGAIGVPNSDVPVMIGGLGLDQYTKKNKKAKGQQ